MKDCNNARYRQSNTNAYRRIWQPSASSPFSPTSPGVYDYSSLPSSPKTLISVDTFPTFNIEKALTNSEEFLNLGRTEKLGKLIKSGLPSKPSRNQNKTSFGTTNKSIDGLGYKPEKLIEENLIQLDDSPKHSLRARKPYNATNDVSNNINANKFLFEDGSNFSISTPPQLKSFL